MLRMTKQTDYGFVLLSRLAAAPTAVLAAPELAEETRLPLPMVSKILKLLARHGLLASHRGVKGGYSLARPAAGITAAEILRALEGPVALTVCIEGSPGECDREPYCEVRRHWQAINEAVDGALGRITLDDLARPAEPGLVRIGAGPRPGAGADSRVAMT
jgi:FeS assembly SUF system regulator